MSLGTNSSDDPDFTHPRLGGGGFPNSKVIGGYNFGNGITNPAPYARVLIVGGMNTNWEPPAHVSAEVYDPLSGTWSPTGSLKSGRGTHAATLLPDGRVLVGGGIDWPSNPCEVYDPSRQAWTSVAGSDGPPFIQPTLTMLSDGTAMFAGGRYGLSRDVVQGWSGGVWEFDPSTQSVAYEGRAFEGHADHTATLLPDGWLLVVGRVVDNDSAPCAELLSRSLHIVADAGPLNSLRSGHTATLLTNGLVLVAGGYDSPWVGSGEAMSSAELFDPAEGSWRLTGSMVIPRAFATATLLANGEVLVAGGIHQL